MILLYVTQVVNFLSVSMRVLNTTGSSLILGGRRAWPYSVGLLPVPESADAYYSGSEGVKGEGVTSDDDSDKDGQLSEWDWWLRMWLVQITPQR